MGPRRWLRQGARESAVSGVLPVPARLSTRELGLRAAGGLDLALVTLLGAVLLLRVLTDDLSSPDSRQSGSLDLSAGIAALLVLVALGLLLRHRRGVLPAALATLWLCTWTAIALGTHGASTTTLREGVREGSVVALAVIVYNTRGAITATTAARLVQLIGFVPALIALYQLATHTGMDISGHHRANGTFAHPDSAAMFFAIAVSASLWLYLDGGRRRADALLTALFAAAVVGTLSIDGLLALVAMLIGYGALRGGPLRARLEPGLVAGLVLVAFLATPLGAQRITKEASSRLASVERGEAGTSLEWRLDKWKLLLPKWEASPLFGEGLGTTTTTVSIHGNRFSGKPPHNEYVRYLVETGVVGTALLLWALTGLVRSLRRRWRSSRAVDASAFNAAALALVVIAGCLVNALADNTFLNSPTCYAATLIVVAALIPQVAEKRRAT